MAACSRGRSCSVTPCRFMLLITSMTTRAPRMRPTPSTEETERMARSGSGTGSSSLRNGVSTSRSPPNRSFVRAAS